MELNLNLIANLNFILSDNKVHLTQIETLYFETFTTGDAAQHINTDILKNYLSNTLNQGKAVMCFDQNTLIGCLLYAPLTIDLDCPSQILNNFPPEKGAYITEIMVEVNYRGQGIGRKLLNSFFETVCRNQYADVFIRVWNQNLVALKLYESIGFKIISSIQQNKLQVDGVTSLSMTKLYLHKPL